MLASGGVWAIRPLDLSPISLDSSSCHMLLFEAHLRDEPRLETYHRLSLGIRYDHAMTAEPSPAEGRSPPFLALSAITITLNPRP